MIQNFLYLFVGSLVNADLDSLENADLVSEKRLHPVDLRLLSCDIEVLRVLSFLVNTLLRHKQVAVVRKDYASKAALDCSLGG